MALFDNPPHLANTYTVNAGTRDAGGGTPLTYTIAQSSLPCSIQTASASEREMFAQQGIVVSHTVAYLTATASPAVTRGMKVVNQRTAKAYHVHGISSGEEYGNIPPLSYLYCEEIL